MKRINTFDILKQQSFGIKADLKLLGIKQLTGEKRRQILKGSTRLKNTEIAVVSRLKLEAKIKAKMDRFGEPRSKILDTIGHRVIVADLSQLEMVINKLRFFGETPTKNEMLLRNGKLSFPWIRDYRKKSHTGKSVLTSTAYNEAVHMNRKIARSICEIQVVTYALYKRAFVNRSGDVAHAQFARRRTKKYQ